MKVAVAFSVGVGVALFAVFLLGPSVTSKMKSFEGEEQVASGAMVSFDTRTIMGSAADNQKLVPSLRMSLSDSVADKSAVLNQQVKQLQQLKDPTLHGKAEALQTSEAMLKDVKALLSEIDFGDDYALYNNLLGDVSKEIDEFLVEVPKLKRVVELGADVMEGPFEDDAHESPSPLYGTFSTSYNGSFERHNYGRKLNVPGDDGTTSGRSAVSVTVPTLNEKASTRNSDGQTGSRSAFSPRSAKRAYQHHFDHTKKRHARHFDRDPKTKRKHDHLSKFHEALIYGDHNHIDRVLGSYCEMAAVLQEQHNGQFGRRMQSTSELKGRQCMQLVKCAKGMSHYDMMVYYYYDDIDKNSGEIDDDIFVFDEKDLHAKYIKISKLSKDLFNKNKQDASNYGSDPGCDNLLQMFHRNIEKDGIPHWEGATVSQVCQAEGTQVYMKLKDVAKKVGTWSANFVSEELFQCSKDLYNSDARTTGESFVFSNLVKGGQKFKTRTFGPDKTRGVKNWKEATNFCKTKGYSGLAGLEEYCTDGKLSFSPKDGDNWSPIGDYENGWVSVGTHHSPCLEHRTKFGDPAWGTDSKQEPVESNYIMCSNNPAQLFGPEKTRGIKNWKEATNFCKTKGFSGLAGLEEYCTDGTLSFSPKDGDNWSPIGDYENGWVSVGTHHSPCLEHKKKFGDPAWGTDSKQESFESNYVLCSRVSATDPPNTKKQQIRLPHYYEDQKTWRGSIDYCKSKGQRLCTYDEICPNGAGGKINLPSEANPSKALWLPFSGDTHKQCPGLNADNGLWLMVGTCDKHTIHNPKCPGWGRMQDAGGHYSCPDKYSRGHYGDHGLVCTTSYGVTGSVGAAKSICNSAGGRFWYPNTGPYVCFMGPGCPGGWDSWGYQEGKGMACVISWGELGGEGETKTYQGSAEGDCAAAGGKWDYSGTGPYKCLIPHYNRASAGYYSGGIACCNSNRRRFLVGNEMRALAAGYDAKGNFEGSYKEDFIVPSGYLQDRTVRDIHGQMLENSDPFEYSTQYTPRKVASDLSKAYKKLYDETGLKNDQPDPSDPEQKWPAPSEMYADADHYLKVEAMAKKEENKKYKEYLKKIGKGNSDSADAYDKIEDGIKLVFGGKPSVGYLCGVKEAVLNSPAKYPGSCCLDAPFQNDGDHWGRKYDCNTPCKRKAPFFAGISSEACSAQGGTWCANPTDCSVLKKCVEDEEENAVKNKKKAYATYLGPGNVTDPTSASECGKARQYFGYDPLFTNDEEICENIRQQQNTKDFSFLSETYDDTEVEPKPNKGGYSSNKQLPNTEQKEIEWKELTEPPTWASEPTYIALTTLKVAGAAWSALNFGLEVGKDIVNALYEAAKATKCDLGEWTASVICATLVNAVVQILLATKTAMEAILKVSSWVYDNVVENGLEFIGDIVDGGTSTETGVLYDNMVAIDTNLKGLAKAQNHKITRRHLEESNNITIAVMEQKLYPVHEVLQRQGESLDALQQQQQVSLDSQSAAVQQLQAMLEKQNAMLLMMAEKIESLQQQQGGGDPHKSG